MNDYQTSPKFITHNSSVIFNFASGEKCNSLYLCMAREGVCSNYGIGLALISRVS